MTPSLSGRVIAILGSGSEQERAIAVACAGAGADIALGTLAATQDQEFATASIANEVWALGREQLVRVLDASQQSEVGAFASEVISALGRCDTLIFMGGSIHDAPDAFALAFDPSRPAVIVLVSGESADATEVARLRAKAESLNDALSDSAQLAVFAGSAEEVLSFLWQKFS